MTKNTELPEITVGVVGHIDHGKTTLLSKLTGKFADTHSEELKRGITIKLGYADTTICKDGNTFNNKGKGTPVRYVSFIDAPGHEMLMATMLSGAAIIDAAILVVSAQEGIKPQTREHFIALQAKKIKNIIIVQNKIDLVSKERALESYKEIKDFIKGTYAENAKIIPVSSLQEINLDKIFEALVEFPIPERDSSSDPLFLIARSFDINRPGTDIKNLKGGVLGGILKKGKLKVGDFIEIKPGISEKKANQLVYSTVRTKIIAIHKGNTNVQEISPGASISLETSLDPAMAKTDFLNGCLVSLEGKLPEITYNLKMKAELFKEVLGMNEKKAVDSFKASETLMLSVGTTITVGIVKKIKPSNGKYDLELSLSIPAVPIKGENIGIARNILGHWRLIGFGEII